MKKRLYRVLAACCVFSAGVFGWAREHKGTELARVRFLATATSVRGPWAFNQDTYLAQMNLPDGKSSLVRVLDEFMHADRPLSATALESKDGTMLRLRRDSTCDRLFSSMTFRPAPGDPIANIDAPLSYSPELPNRVDPAAIVACYRLVRR